MSNLDPSSIAKLLPWDSNFFGQKIARVNGNELDAVKAKRINTWAIENKVACLYFLASSENDNTILCAEANGYHFVDLRVTLYCPLNKLPTFAEQSNSIRFAVEKDIPALKQIAAINHTNSRFFTDQHFDRNKCRELYEVWIEKCVVDPDSRVFVWDDQGEASAYVTAKLQSNKVGAIELVGLAPRLQGKGYGKQLIAAALNFFSSNGMEAAETVTQGRNLHALKLYQKCGFFIQSIEMWYHKWMEIQS